MMMVFGRSDFLKLIINSLESIYIFVSLSYVLALKASCREIFCLDVVLSNAIGQTVRKDVEVHFSYDFSSLFGTKLSTFLA